MENNLNFSALSAHPQISDMALVSLSDISSLIRSIDVLKSEIKLLKEKVESPRIYNNNSIKELLDIGDKVLKRLRDEGYLGYHRHGDKYWYTQNDIDNFLSIIHITPFMEAA